MGKKSSRFFRAASVAAFSALVLGAFQNCGVNVRHGSLGDSQKMNGNGEGYGGKVTVFVNRARLCEDGKPSAVIERRDADFYLTRENCASVTPVRLGAGDVENLDFAPDVALFASRLFVRADTAGGSTNGHPGDANAPASGLVLVCRYWSSQTAYPREVTDLELTQSESGTSVNVRIARYDAPGAASVAVASVDNWALFGSASNDGSTWTYQAQINGSSAFTLYLPGKDSASTMTGQFQLKLDLTGGLLQRSGAATCYRY